MIFDDVQQKIIDDLELNVKPIRVFKLGDGQRLTGRVEGTSKDFMLVHIKIVGKSERKTVLINSIMSIEPCPPVGEIV